MKSKPTSQVYKPNLGKVATMGAHDNKVRSERTKIATGRPKANVTGHCSGSQGKH